MDYEGFKKEVYCLTGINLDCYKEKQMKRRINSLIAKHKYEGYFDFLQAIKVNNQLFDEFVNHLTINVSEFYRNPEQWKVLENDIIKSLLQNTTNLKIWSSACSTGDEPYTIVMVLNKFIPLEKIRIIATDIDLNAIEKAKRGEYSEKSIKSLPQDYIDKYFKKTNENYVVKDEVKKCVEFKQLNLLKDTYPSNCDLIVCRNVLIYFTEEAKNDIYQNFNKSLKPKGVLFIGSTEQIIGYQKYGLKPYKTFFYIKEENVLSYV